MITTIATNEEIPQILVEGIFDDEAYVVAEDAAEFALKNGFGEGVPTAAFRIAFSARRPAKARTSCAVSRKRIAS